MTATIAPHPLPAGFEADGLEPFIRARFECECRWLKDWEVILFLPGEGRRTWAGFVHEFKLIGHSSVQRCFAIRNGPRETQTLHLYPVAGRIGDAEDAVRAMFAEIAREQSA